MSKILLVTGPGGAGKSTACGLFADSVSGTWALIEQDEIRRQVKAGFKNPSEYPWTDEMQKQWDVSIEICADIATRYKNVGISCIIDCFAASKSFDKWEKALQGLDYQVVVLLPEEDETVRRNNQRSGEAKLKESQIREHHEWFAMWRDDKRVKIIDTTNYSIDEVVEELTNLAHE